MKPVLPEGARVHVHHLRRVRGSSLMITAQQAKKGGLEIEGKGGLTWVDIELPDGSSLYGEARCSPRDNYSKLKGRMIATGRALKTLEARA